MFPVPMVLVVPADNRQRHHLSQIRLLLLFQWKWVASHQGDVRKQHLNGPTQHRALQRRLTSGLIIAAGSTPEQPITAETTVKLLRLSVIFLDRVGI